MTMNEKLIEITKRLASITKKKEIKKARKQRRKNNKAPKKIAKKIMVV